MENTHPRTSRLFIPLAPEPTLWGYTYAVGYCLAAFGLRLLLDPILKDHSPLVVFALAVAVSAIRGFGPGILATLLSAFGALYFFPPTGRFDYVEPSYRPTAAFQIVVFIAIGYLLSWLGGESRRLRWSAVEFATERNRILESITDGFIALNGECQLVFLNQTAAKLADNGKHAVGNSIWDEIPKWRTTVVETQLRASLRDHTGVQFEFESPDSNTWLEFRVHPAERGGLTVYFSDITDRKSAEAALREVLAERNAALKQVHLLSGLLPICADCKQIRDEQGTWHPLESYISSHSQARFSHGLCAACARKYLEELRHQT